MAASATVSATFAPVAAATLREWRCDRCPSTGHRPRLLGYYDPAATYGRLTVICPKCGRVCSLPRGV